MILFDSFSRIVNGMAPRVSRQVSAVWMYDSIFSGVGMDVYHNFHNSPSLTAAVIPSKCSRASGSTMTFEPIKVTGSIQRLLMAFPFITEYCHNYRRKLHSPFFFHRR